MRYINSRFTYLLHRGARLCYGPYWLCGPDDDDDDDDDDVDDVGAL